MSQDYFFGYGSLVNLDTHSFGGGHRTSLKGWRRVWQCAPSRPVSFLSVIPDDAGCEIYGLAAPVPAGDWDALDAREASYDRIDITEKIGCSTHGEARVGVYSIRSTAAKRPDRDHPILLSYVDTVLQGYLHQFGTDGVGGFMQTTDGWEGSVLNDRDNPRYPRATSLKPQERRYVDAILEDSGVVPFR